METRLRVLLVDAGLPAPELQFPVQDPVTRTAVWLDLAYPEQRVGIEFEGPDHLIPQRVRHDIRRATNLVDRGWRLYRLLATDVYTTPARTIAMITRALAESPRAA